MRLVDRERLKRAERLVKKVLSKTILHPFRHSFLHWRVGLRRSKTSLLQDGLSAMPSFRWIEAPKGHFYADPMLFQHEGRTWLFVEDYLYSTNEAHRILAAEVAEDGALGEFYPALTVLHHVSFPLVFCHEQAIYMVPETAANRTVQLYRAVQFPYRWRFEKVLFPHPGFDTTPFHHDGTWYFFVTIPEQGIVPRHVTHLFWAESLTGEWKLHPASPIAPPQDGRSAGPIFTHDEVTIRPTQCGKPVYGYSFSFDQIEYLDRRRFEQRRIATFEPTWHRYLRGMHTYGRAGGFEVIDGCWGVNTYDVM